MKKKFFTSIIAALILIPFILSTGWAKTLKIGSISPLTGPYAADGNDIKNGVLAAIKVIEQDGGIPGYDKIELLPQDSACDPKQAVAAANKLPNERVAGVIGAYCSSSTIPASETLAEDDIIMITPASTNEKVTERGLKYMFRACGRDDDQSKAAGRFMRDYLETSAIFIVDDKTTYSQGLADNVEKECRKYGITVIGRDHVNQGDKDFSAVLTLVKSVKPDILYMSLQNSSSGSLMAIQARRFGLKCKILSEDAVFHPNFIKVAKKAAENVYFTYGSIDKRTDAYKKYERVYTSSYGEIGAYATYAYDSAMVLLKAIKKAGSAKPSKVRKQILKMNFQGASKWIKFKKNGDSGSNYIVFKVINGEYVPFWSPQKGLL